MNDIKVVFLDNLRPGNDGELILSVSTAGGSPYSFSGAYTIEFYDDASPDEPVINTIYTEGPPPSRAVNTELPITHVLPPAKPVVTARQPEAVSEIVTQEIKVFPNPFTGPVQVKLQSDKAAEIAILLYDVNGRLMYKSNGLHAVKGANTISVNLANGVQLPPGMYILNVLIDGKISKAERLIKVN